MIHLFINAVAASAGGGLTYLRNFIPCLAARPDVRATVLLASDAQALFGWEPGRYENVTFLGFESCGATSRFLREQIKIPSLMAQHGADVLLSTGNFALRYCSVPQILLSRNALYTCPDYYRDLLTRGHYRTWVQERLKKVLAMRSVQWADCTVAPSQSFANELRSVTKKEILAIHHGFGWQNFFRSASPPTNTIAQKNGDPETLRLVFVSHYNYYRNFETLLRALFLIKQQLAPRAVKLFLTCDLSSPSHSGIYSPKSAAKLLARLGLRDNVVDLGPVPYEQLHELYAASTLYVTAAYAESFAHPLVEAMASGLPVIASDLAVHRETCGSAAVYFPRFSPEALAKCVVETSSSPATAARLRNNGLRRAQHFSWMVHVEEIIELAQQLYTRRSGKIAMATAAD
jgi:glycosyltransferase involved in cell wall biosynthesis